MSDFMKRGLDDESRVTLEYELEGETLLAVVEAGYHAPGKTREITITGTELSAVCDFNVAQYKIKTFANRHSVEGASVKATEGEMRQLEFPPEEPLRAELSAFLESMETRKPYLSDASSGEQAVRVVEAALESARSGGWVDLVP
jgi:predicted dehydrogenase